MYNNGFEFWRDLVLRHGAEDARRIAIDYLDLQISSADPEEKQFCKQVYAAMQ